MLIAEGVETEAHRKILQEWHCDELQGYLISKPLSADQFEALLETTTRRVQGYRPVPETARPQLASAEKHTTA